MTAEKVAIVTAGGSGMGAGAARRAQTGEITRTIDSLTIEKPMRS